VAKPNSFHCCCSLNHPNWTGCKSQCTTLWMCRLCTAHRMLYRVDTCSRVHSNGVNLTLMQMVNLTAAQHYMHASSMTAHDSAQFLQAEGYESTLSSSLASFCYLSELRMPCMQHADTNNLLICRCVYIPAKRVLKNKTRNYDCKKADKCLHVGHKTLDTSKSRVAPAQACIVLISQWAQLCMSAALLHTRGA